MKKLIYSLLSLAAMLTLASCQPDKLINGTAGDGATVDATFTVELGNITKAFADGEKADVLQAGLYKVGTNPAYTLIDKVTNASISNKASTITFNGKLEKNESYVVVFWAQDADCTAYSLSWGDNAPVLTVTPSGNANDDTRDAFYGSYSFGPVTQSVTAPTQTLRRPFAQVNVMIPMANVPQGDLSSSMTVAQAPTTLNLITKDTGSPFDYVFANHAITEDAFTGYAGTHTYAAMNYVLVDQKGADPRYDVTVDVIADTEDSGAKTVASAPLKPNVRTNIVGNVFSTTFDLSVPVSIDSDPTGSSDIRSITVLVGGNEAPAGGVAVPVSSSQELNLSYPGQESEVTATSSDTSVATVAVNGQTVTVTGVANGTATITIVVASGTKAGTYDASSTSVDVVVGTGVKTPVFDPASGSAVQAGSKVTITSSAGASIYYTMGDTPADPNANSNAYPEGGITVNENTTIKAIAINGNNQSEIATATYTLAAKPAQTLTVKVGDDTVGATLDKTYGDAGFSLTVTGNEGGLTYESASTSVATISDGGAISIVGAGSSIITVTAAETQTSAETSKVFTLIVAKKAATLTLGNNSATVTASETTNVTYTTDSDGVISVASSDDNTATAVVDNGNIVITGVAAGSATLTVSIAAGNNYVALTPNQTINVTVNAAQAPTYAVNLAAMTNGYVSRDKETAEAGETVALTITPAANYELSTITVNKAQGTVELYGDGNTRTFIMPAEPVTVSATFTAIPSGIPAGDYVVAVKSAEQYIPMTSTVTSNRFDSAAAFAYTSGTVNALVANVWTLASTVGGYTLEAKAHDGQYVVFVSGQNQAGLSNTGSVLSFEEQQGGGYYVTVTDNATTRYLSKNTSSNYFAFYGNTGQNAVIYLIPAQVAEQVATPTITGANDATEIPAGEGTLSVTLACATLGATIYYTTNGDTPTINSTEYTTPLSLSSACTVKAIAVKNDMIESEVASQAFTKAGAAIVQYEKVTVAPDDWSGTYILVYEESATSGRVCTAGVDASSNYVSATISSGVISSNDLSDYEVEIATYSTGYSVKALGGTNENKYLEGKGSDSNGTTFAASESYVTTLALSDGVVTITNNTNVFAYNSAANNWRWRFFKKF